MIEHELLLLGLLKESPKHGYEIKMKIKEILSLFAGVDLKSIYYPLKVLEKKQLVKKHVSKTGKRPERIVYALTPKGEGCFQELLSASLLDFKRPQFSLELSLYFLRYIKPVLAKRRLRARMMILKRLSRDLQKMLSQARKKSPHTLAYIVEHDLQMVDTESAFLEKLLNTI